MDPRPNALLVVLSVGASFACLTPKGYRTGSETMVVQPDGSLDKESGLAKKVRVRAAVMMACDRKEVHVQQVNHDTFNVAGCDQNLTLRCFTAKHFDCKVLSDEEPKSATVTTASTSSASKSFDTESARRVLSSIAYADCGSGGIGKLQVTFAPTGTATKIEIVEGNYDENVIKCLVARFRAVTTPAFDGEEHVVRWTIKLP